MSSFINKNATNLSTLSFDDGEDFKLPSNLEALTNDKRLSGLYDDRNSMSANTNNQNAWHENSKNLNPFEVCYARKKLIYIKLNILDVFFYELIIFI